MDPATIGVAVATAVVVVILTVLVLYLYNSGLFWTPEVEIRTPPVRELTIMYKTGSGAYEKSGTIFNELQKLAPDLDSVGLYYDDPSKVAAANLRWAVAAILANGKEEVDIQMQGKLEAAGFRRHKLPCVDQAVITEWYVGTKLAFLLMIRRVYPTLCKFMEEKEPKADAPCVEIYEDCQLTLMFPLDHTEGFFLPEFKEKTS